MTTQSEILAFYEEPAGMTDAGRHGSALAEIPADASGVARAVQGILLHEHLAGAYRQTLTPERLAQSHLRSVTQMLDCALQIDPSPISEPRAPEKRLVGVCRHFAVLACAILRGHGVPARARCGFCVPRDGGLRIDHWITEYFDGVRWRQADFQIDDVQRRLFKIDFDTLDQPLDTFLSGGRAWQLCRTGKADGETFGIGWESGLWFVGANVLRDFAALNKYEMLPWDVWGPMTKAEDAWTHERLALFDQLAALTTNIDNRFDEARGLYTTRADLRVPGRVFNALRQVEEAA